MTTWYDRSALEELPNVTETFFEKTFFDVYLDFLVWSIYPIH